MLGFVSAVQFLPFTCFSLFAGTIIDRFPKKHILLVTQAFSMLLAFILAFLVFTNTVTYASVVIVAFFLGLANSFDLPTRQSFNIEIVGKEDIMNAVALNSSTLNLARIIGPSVGAVLMISLGPGWCFLLNGLTYAGVIYGLLRMEITPYVRSQPVIIVSILHENKDGLRYLSMNRNLLTAMLLVLLVGLFGFNFNILIPVYT